MAAEEGDGSGWTMAKETTRNSRSFCVAHTIDEPLRQHHLLVPHTNYGRASKRRKPPTDASIDHRRHLPAPCSVATPSSLRSPFRSSPPAALPRSWKKSRQPFRHDSRPRPILQNPRSLFGLSVPILSASLNSLLGPCCDYVVL
ncbi:hypothetical protein KM043_000745 [Ampulex compressa]|nr:hypothetical protein KM043_000745 [Ampulex compressa]